MIISSPKSPLLLSTPIHITWYGVLIASAILLSYFLALRLAKKAGISETKFDASFLITVVFGILGARLGFVVQNVSYYSSHISQVFAFWQGGMSIHGAIILGLLGLYLSVRIYKLNFLELANILVPFVMLSGAIGRWGNFFNQEIVGRPSSGFLKLFIDEAHRPPGFEKIEYFHPVFLYESLLLFSAFIIYAVMRKRLQGIAVVYTLVAYSLIRIIVEFWRIDYKPIFLGLDLAQWVSFGIIAVAVISAFYIISHTNKK